MPTEETSIKFTFPPAELLEQTMSEKTVQAEFGSSICINHMLLAILLMFDNAAGRGDGPGRELALDIFEQLFAKLKTGKGKSAFKLMKEMYDE